MENNRVELNKTSLVESDQSLVSATSKMLDQSLSYLNEHKTEIVLGAAAAVILGTSIKMLANAGEFEGNAALHADEFPNWFRPSGAAPQTDEFYALTQGHDPIYSSVFASTPKRFIPDSQWPDALLNRAGGEGTGISFKGDGALMVRSRNFTVDGSLADVEIKNSSGFANTSDRVIRNDAVLNQAGDDVPGISFKGDGSLIVRSRNFTLDGSLADVEIKNSRVSAAARGVLQDLQMRGVDLPDSLKQAVRKGSILRD